MASNEIKHRVSLEGDADINRRLDGIGEHGKRAFKEISETINNASPGIAKIGNDFASIEGKAEGGRQATERFREAIHTLHPVLDEAGLGLGNLGAFARAAGVGVGGLAAAIVGSILVALAKMGDEAIVAKKRLGDLLQNPTGGKSLFDALKKQANELGTEVSNLLPSMENLITLRNKTLSRGNERYAPGSAPIDSPAGGFSNEKLFAFQKTLFEALKAGKAPTDEATKALADFTGELAKTGQLSTGMVENLAKTAPNAANVLARSLQQGYAGYQDLLNALEKGTKVSAEEIIRDLARIGPAVHEALVNAPKDTKTFSDALDAAKHSASELLDVLKGPNVSIPVLETLSEILKQDKTDLEAIIGLWRKLLELLENSSLGSLTSKIASATGEAKKPNDRVSEGFGQLPGSPEKASPTGSPSTSAATSQPQSASASPSESGTVARQAPLREGVDFLPPAGTLSENKEQYLKENGSFDGFRNPTSDAARSRYYGKTFENLPPELQVSPIYQKQKLEDEITTGAHLVGEKSPNVVDGPLAGQESIDRRLTAQKIFPSPFDADKRLQYEKEALSKNTITDAGPFNHNPGDTTRIREVGQDLIDRATLEYQRKKRALELKDYGKAFDNNPVGIADYDKAPPSDYDQSKEHRDAVKALEFPQLRTYMRKLLGLPSSAPPIKYLENVPTEPGDPSGIRVRPIDEADGYATGGHIRGPGTSTSDSIPAMLSDGEYVVNADKVRKYGVPLLDAINKGIAHFADGGTAKPAPDFRGDLSVTYDPNTGGAYINGNLYPPGSPILDDPRVKAAIEASKASMNDASSGKHHSPFSASGDFGDFTGQFGGGFKDGGLIGSARSAFAGRLAVPSFGSGGYIDVSHMAHMASGGMPEMPSMDSHPSSSSSDLGLLHPVTLNLPGGGSVSGVFAQPDAVAQLRRAAADEQRYQTGKAPGWYGGPR